MKVAATAWAVMVVDMDNGILLVVVAAQDKRVNSRSPKSYSNIVILVIIIIIIITCTVLFVTLRCVVASDRAL
jgi:hypothetical protein